MLSYKFKLYSTKQSKHLDKMLDEASWVWNTCLATQKRYYKIFGKYASSNDMQKHFCKRWKIKYLHSQSVQEIIQRLDCAYQRFFKKLSARPPKFKRATEFTSFVFKQGGYKLVDNKLTINKIKKTFKFSKSRDIEGNIKQLIVKRNRLGEYFIVAVSDTKSKSYTKSHNGASVGMDFGLKTYLTISDGNNVECPQYLKDNLLKYKRLSRNLSKCVKGSNNREHKRKALCKLFLDIKHHREEFQWQLSHKLCRTYDNIFLEDLNVKGMVQHKNWGRKMNDLCFSDFVLKLEQVAFKYGVVVHRIDRFYPSSQTCSECGGLFKGTKNLTLREWTCPHCGSKHDRDLNASKNILRKGISELESDSKTSVAMRQAERSR